MFYFQIKPKHTQNEHPTLDKILFHLPLALLFIMTNSKYASFGKGIGMNHDRHEIYQNRVSFFYLFSSSFYSITNSRKVNKRDLKAFNLQPL